MFFTEVNALDELVNLAQDYRVILRESKSLK